MGKNATKNKLIFSIIIDIIGMGSYLIPIIGEFLDLIWAPISGILIKIIYGDNFFVIFGTAEELLPFTDIIPTATICWFYYYFREKEEI